MVVITATMFGYSASRQATRLTSSDSSVVINFTLTMVAARLPVVHSQGERARPIRSEIGGEFHPGAAVAYLDLSRSLSGDVTGDLGNNLATLPGIILIPGGDYGAPQASAFGLPSNQNSVVLNGLTFASAAPRDGFGAYVIAATYDPGRGGFAGVQTSLRMNPGTNFINRSVHVTASPNIVGKGLAAASGSNGSDQQSILSGVWSGPLRRDKAFYSVAFQISRQVPSGLSLFSSSRGALSAVGVNADSVEHLRSILASFGVTNGSSNLSGARTGLTDGRVALRLDLASQPPSAPANILTGGVPGAVDNSYFQIGGAWREGNANAAIATAAATTATAQSHRDVWTQLTLVKYLPGGFLNEVTGAVASALDGSRPVSSLPSMDVVIDSRSLDETLQATSVQIGGSLASFQTRSSTVEIRDEISRYSWDRRHKVTLTADWQRASADEGTSSTLGEYEFNSLSDLAANAPSRYSRLLPGEPARGSLMTSAIGLGDVYSASPKLRAEYGVRVEGALPSIPSALNTRVESLFGLRTDHSPPSFAVLPMVGFSWQTLGELFVIQSGGSVPRGTISGGIREYRGALSASSLVSLMNRTGVAGTVRRLDCVGAATPRPDWTALLYSIDGSPNECADGGTGEGFAQVAPVVAVLAPDFSPSRTWRPVLNIAYRLNPAVSVSIGTAYGISINQPETYDVNFHRQAQFALPREADRPVFVSPGDFIPGTGATSFVNSRLTNEFGAVNELRSNLKSTNEAVTVGASVTPFSSGPLGTRWQMAVSYRFSTGREQHYGFATNTDGDPAQLTWSRSGAPAHVFTSTASIEWPQRLTIGVSARAQSGFAFTPLVVGDVNGDGYSNDRAFIFDPKAKADSTVASGMSRLLDGVAPNIQRCLRDQRGRVAATNSCVGGWTVPLMSLAIAPDPSLIHLGNHATASILLANIADGLDIIAHGAGHLHGWGQWGAPDPVLLMIRGFDSRARAFSYAVNPRFGSPVVGARVRTPFTVSIDVRLDVGPAREGQFVRETLRARDQRSASTLTVDEIKVRISPRVSNPFDAIVGLANTMKLSAEQIDSLRRFSKSYVASRDSLVTGLARYIESLHGNYDNEEIVKHWHSTGVAIYESAQAIGRRARVTFTADQLRQLRHSIPEATFVTSDYTLIEIERFLRSPMSSLP